MDLQSANVVSGGYDGNATLSTDFVPSTMSNRLRAVVDDVEDSVVVKALRDIADMPLQEQPKALRDFATQRVVPPENDSVAYTAWAKTLARTKIAIAHNVEIAKNPTYEIDLGIVENSLRRRSVTSNRFAANPPFTAGQLFTQPLALIQGRAMALYGVVSTERRMTGMSETAYREFRYRCTAEVRYETFLETGDAWKPMVRSHSPFPTWEGEDWAKRSRAHFRHVERDAYAVVNRERETPSLGLPEDGDDLFLPTYIDITVVMQEAGNALTCLEKVLRLPLGFQPAAMDRWANLLRHDVDKAHGEWLLQKVSAWRGNIVRQCVERGDYGLAVRAYVAEMRTARTLCETHGVDEIVVRASSAVFDTFPTAFFGDLLAFLYESEANGKPLISAETLSHRSDQFLRCGDARMRFSSSAFSAYLANIVGREFAVLPDIASENETKMMALCERMAIQIADRLEFQWVVLRRIASAVPATPLNRRAAIRHDLGKADLFDPINFGFVLQAVRERVALMVPGAATTLA